MLDKLELFLSRRVGFIIPNIPVACITQHTTGDLKLLGMPNIYSSFQKMSRIVCSVFPTSSRVWGVVEVKITTYRN